MFVFSFLKCVVTVTYLWSYIFFKKWKKEQNNKTNCPWTVTVGYSGVAVATKESQLESRANMEESRCVGQGPMSWNVVRTLWGQFLSYVKQQCPSSVRFFSLLYLKGSWYLTFFFPRKVPSPLFAYLSQALPLSVHNLLAPAWLDDNIRISRLC